MAQKTPAKLTAGLLALAALIVLLASVALAAAPPKRGAPAPAFSLPVVVNGNGNLSLAALKGHAVYLNFFASWCEPCKQEVPYIGTLSKEYSKRNIVVVGVDVLESADKAKEFAIKYHVPYRVTLDDNGDVGGSYGLIGLPLHVFISPNGNVAAYRVGEMSEPQIRTELQALAAAHN
ncbi:MAG TPA: TlpA disulfide reductase family protein [Candidatus Eremiobacteraceae bacterium]|nr:TlpA disulfide reductase family protein [Candidatus Eremiobacteraceae bacterium]